MTRFVHSLSSLPADGKQTKLFSAEMAQTNLRYGPAKYKRTIQSHHRYENRPKLKNKKRGKWVIKL